MTRDQMEAHLSLHGWEPKRFAGGDQFLVYVLNDLTFQDSPWELWQGANAVLQINGIWGLHTPPEAKREPGAFSDIPLADFYRLAEIAMRVWP